MLHQQPFGDRFGRENVAEWSATGCQWLQAVANHRSIGDRSAIDRRPVADQIRRRRWLLVVFSGRQLYRSAYVFYVAFRFTITRR